jgi:hypothetical protein
MTSTTVELLSRGLRGFPRKTTCYPKLPWTSSLMGVIFQPIMRERMCIRSLVSEAEPSQRRRRGRHKTGESTLDFRFLILGCHEVASNIQSCIEQRTNEKSTQPQFTSNSITYDKRTLTVFPQTEQLSLTVL